MLTIISFNFLISEQLKVFVWIKTFHDCILVSNSERFKKISLSKKAMHHFAKQLLSLLLNTRFKMLQYGN